MPIKEFITEEKVVRGRTYKKVLAFCSCDYCGKEWKAKRWNKDSVLSFCSRKCVNSANKKDGSLDKKRRETNLQRYGSESVLQNPEIKEKRKKTIEKRFGTSVLQHSEEWKRKRKETIHRKYGKEIFQTEEFKQKREETLLSKYGVDTPIRSEVFLEKRRKTNLDRYGGEPLKNPEILDKMFQTNLKRYGYKTSFDLEEVQDKCFLANHGKTREEFHANISEYREYRRAVRSITERQSLSDLVNYSKRGRDTFHLDHIYSIADGFRRGVPPEIVGDIVNLRFIDARENQKKSDSSEITEEELIRRYSEKRR